MKYILKYTSTTISPSSGEEIEIKGYSYVISETIEGNLDSQLREEAKCSLIKLIESGKMMPKEKTLEITIS